MLQTIRMLLFKYHKIFFHCITKSKNQFYKYLSESQFFFLIKMMWFHVVWSDWFCMKLIERLSIGIEIYLGVKTDRNNSHFFWSRNLMVFNVLKHFFHITYIWIKQHKMVKYHVILPNVLYVNFWQVYALFLFIVSFRGSAE